jgi:uncharacterized protein YbaA (DUF1428 family)
LATCLNTEGGGGVMEKQYVDGYVLTVPKKNLEVYKKMASDAGKVWMKHGALQYVECVGEDLNSAAKWGCLPFPTLTKAKPDETIIFAYIVYTSREHRDTVNAKVEKEMKDSGMDKEYCEKTMPFDMKRMAVGGFETIVNL